MCFKDQQKTWWPKCKKALESLENGNLTDVADITLTYYDKSYNFGLEKRKNNTVYPIKLEADDPEKNAEILIEFAKTTF